MLKLTKKVDYALLALHHMGYLSVGPLANAKEIAETYQIPVEMLAKILQTLSRADIIASENGPKGGYALSRLPEHISVAEIIQAVEGPIGIADCVTDGGSPCMQEDTCTIRTPIEQIQQRIRALLSDMSVADMHHQTLTAVVGP